MNGNEIAIKSNDFGTATVSSFFYGLCAVSCPPLLRFNIAFNSFASMMVSIEDPLPKFFSDISANQQSL